MEEDLFHLLAAPPAPQRRRLSLAGARVLARQLGEAAELRHAAAVARVGHSRACPFDLHALVPMPPDILPLGPDHPDSLAWLQAHWGTTEALRHVVLEPALPPRQTPPPGTAGPAAQLLVGRLDTVAGASRSGGALAGTAFRNRPDLPAAMNEPKGEPPVGAAALPPWQGSFV